MKAIWEGEEPGSNQPRSSKLRAFWSRWLGDRGERAAAQFLRKAKMRVLVRGYRTSQGEIDLIARDGDTIVFIEVKTRRQGQPAEAVTAEKQRRLTLAALHFLKRHRLLEQASRFDVVAIVWPEAQKTPTIEYFRHAFEANGQGQMYS